MAPHHRSQDEEEGAITMSSASESENDEPLDMEAATAAIRSRVEVRKMW